MISRMISRMIWPYDISNLVYHSHMISWILWSCILYHSTCGALYHSTCGEAGWGGLGAPDARRPPVLETWTPSPYLRPKCHPRQVLPQCIGALPAWAAQLAVASRLFSMTTNQPRVTTRAASIATSPCAGSRQSLFSWTPAPSTLAMAWPEPVERLASGAPNPPHPAAPQMPWYRMWYH